MRDRSSTATLAISVGLQQFNINALKFEYLNLRPPYERLLEFKRSKLRWLRRAKTLTLTLR